MKKAMKRSLSVLLAVTIIFSSAFISFSGIDLDGFFTVKTEAAELETLTPNNELNVLWNSGEKLVSVVVDESGFYNITITNNDYDGYSSLDCYIYNDSIGYTVGPYSNDFRIFTSEYIYSNMYLEAGTQYFLSIEAFDENDSSCYGDVNLILEKSDYSTKKITDKETIIVSDENEIHWFSVETTVAGEYAMYFGGDEAWCYIYEADTGAFYKISSWSNISTVTLDANKQYIYRVEYTNENAAPQYVSFYKQKKDVKKVELYNAISLGDYLDESDFLYKVTYTDGSSEIVDYYYFEDRGANLYVYYSGEYTSSYYMKPGKQKVTVKYGDIETASYVNIISFVDFVSDLNAVTPYFECTIENRDYSYGSNTFYWRIKVNETGKYDLYSYDGWKDTFCFYNINFIDANNNIIPWDDDGCVLEEGKEYCLEFEYRFDEYVSWDFNFTLEPCGDHVHNYSNCVCTGCGHWKNKSAYPKLTSVTNATNGVTVKWNALAGADGYRIYRKSGSGSWQLISTVKGGTKTSYTDTTAKSGTTYTYTVRGYKGNVLSKYNTTGLKIKFLSTPKLTSISNGSGKVTVKWNKVTGASGYYVYRQTYSNGKWSGWKKVATTKDNYYNDTNVSSGKYYKYTVRAYNGSYVSSYNSTGLKTKYLAVAPLKSAVSQSAGIKVTWGKVTGAKGYVVYRQTYSNGKWSGWSKIKTISSGSTVTYTDKSAKKGVTYKYTVRATSDSYMGYYNTKGLQVKDKY